MRSADRDRGRNLRALFPGLPVRGLGRQATQGSTCRRIVRNRGRSLMAKLAIGGWLLLLGAGKMGGAMLEGWLKLGLDPTSVAVIDPNLTEAASTAFRQRGITVNPDL